MQARGTVALLAAAGLVTGLLTGAPAAVAAGSPGRITTVAGGPGRGPATKVFQDPVALAAGPGGAVYVAGGVVREFSNTDSYENVIAGNGSPLYSGDGGPATRAQMEATAVALDSSGNLVIVDTFASRIRVVAHHTGTFYGQAMTAGDIYTVAGDGTQGYSGDGGPARSAAFLFPQTVAVDAAGNLVVADTDNGRVRVVADQTGTFYGQAMTAGDIYTVAGGGTSGINQGGLATATDLAPWSATVDPLGDIVIADAGNNAILVVTAQTGTFYGAQMTAGHIYIVAGNLTSGYSGDGGPATEAELSFPTGVVADPAGNLVIADDGTLRVRVVAVTTGTFYGQAMTAGDIYTVAGDGRSGLSGSGGLATATRLGSPEAVAFDAAGNLVIADSGYDRVWVVSATTGTFYKEAMTAGHIYIVAGNGWPGFSGVGGKATNAEILGRRYTAEKVAVDGSNYVVVDTQQAWYIANKAGTHFGQAMTAGDIYVVAGNGFGGYGGDGGPATAARFSAPQGIAVDQAGNLVISDTGNYRVRVVAAKTGRFYGQAMTVDHVYTVAGGGTNGLGDGGPATAAELNHPYGVAVDRSGNLVIADTSSRRIRVVAATAGAFYGVAMTAGDIYTVAGNGKYGFSGDGGPATAAALRYPEGVAVDGAGNLVIADTGNARIRVVAATTGTFYGVAMTAGNIYTVAGNGMCGYFADRIPARASWLCGPDAVAVDGAGNLVISDSANNRIRVVAATTATFYGQVMTAGDIYTVAGNGTAGLSGDGGPATAAEVDDPEGVAVDGAGNLVVADFGNGRLRLVTG